MKGIPRLKPIDKPVEGMQVVWKKSIGVWKDNPLTTNPCRFDWKDGSYAWFYVDRLSGLKQIVIEYCDILPEWIERGDNIRERYKKTLPLHPSDWEAALPLIGQEVEFEKVPWKIKGYTEPAKEGKWAEGIYQAKLILPKQEETWDDIEFEYVKTYPCIDKNTPTYEQWIRKHYSPPKRK